MSLVTINFESQYLKNNTDVSIILPNRPRETDAKEFYKSDKKYKVVWLLHGTFGDHTDWLRHTMVEVYACERNLAVVMPSALNSDYVNWNGFAAGYQMWDYFTEELMPLVYGWFPVSDKREDNYIAGLSMGGYGAAMLGTGHPDKFAAVAALSAPPWNPATYFNKERRIWEGLDEELRFHNSVNNAGGWEKYLASQRNTWDIITREYASGKLPEMYFTCGTQDFLYEMFRDFRKHCEQEKMTAIKFEEIEGYTHEWRFWDLAIQRAFDFFGL